VNKTDWLKRGTTNSFQIRPIPAGSGGRDGTDLNFGCTSVLAIQSASPTETSSVGSQLNSVKLLQVYQHGRQSDPLPRAAESILRAGDFYGRSGRYRLEIHKSLRHTGLRPHAPFGERAPRQSRKHSPSS
jgi:hypothetical protein